MVYAAQRSAEASLGGAKKRMELVADGIRLMVVGAMRSGKSTLLSALVGGPALVFPTIAADESFSMVPVEMGAATDGSAQFNFRIQFKSVQSWQKLQQQAVTLLFEEWKMDTPVIDLTTEPSVEATKVEEKKDDEEVNEEERDFLSMMDAGVDTQEPVDEDDVTITRTLQESMIDWLRSPRVGRIKNHPLKSIYSVLDLSDDALTQRSIVLDSPQYVVEQQSAIDLLNTLHDDVAPSHEACKQINALLAHHSGERRRSTLPSVATVHAA